MSISAFNRRLSAFLIPALLAGLFAPAGAAASATAAPRQVKEVIKTYPVQGKTGIDLYASIGRNGPVIAGGGRTIAHTTFRLTWKRDYQPRDGGCVLKSAVPTLIITYMLPKPVAPLQGAAADKWQRFAKGVELHEREHGRYIRELAADIEKATVGLYVEEDPACRKIRRKLDRVLEPIWEAHQERNLAFDRRELRDGGAVHQLILDLVNVP